MAKKQQPEKTLTEMTLTELMQIKCHETAKELPLYRKYAEKKTKNGHDFKTFTEWKKTVYKGEVEL